MATKKSKPRARQGRNKNLKPALPSAAATSVPEALHEAIEDERARLMDAEAVLHCVMIALDDDDRWNTHGPYYQSVIGIARDLVTKTINRLDSVTLRPILARAKDDADSDYAEIDAAVGRKLEIKESVPPEYVH